MKIIKSLILSFLLFTGALLSPRFVLALDNNSSQFGSCDITVEGQNINANNPVRINPSRQENGRNYYNITVCGSPLTQLMGDQEASPNFCMDNGDGPGPSGQELKASINTSPFTWREFELDQYNSETGCYSGVIEARDGDAWDSSGVSIDIELDNDGDHICRTEMPVCRRVQAIFDRNVTLENVDQCTALRQSLENCSFLSVVMDGDNIVVNQPFSITGQVDPLMNSDECGINPVSNPNLTVTGPSGTLHNQRYSPGSNINATITPSQLGVHEVRFTVTTSTVPGAGEAIQCSSNFRVCADGDSGCNSLINNSGSLQDYALCETNLNPGSTAFKNCKSCFDNDGIWTAIGCISQDPRSLVAKLINFGIGISGGIALIIILTSAFSLAVSQGDVKKTTDAKEWITAAVIGLIFIILSVSILEFIGSTVLRIPGFGG